MAKEIVKIENMSICYPDGYMAVDGINLSIEEGSSTAIIGANGAGKSTLLRAMLGLQPLKSGHMFIDDLEVKKENYTKIRKCVGMLFQNPDDQLFQSRVIDDIRYGLFNIGLSEKDINDRVDTIIKQLQIESLRDKLTHKLSGGEKRLVAIAGALVMEPKVLLMDEPTTYLDPRARRNFIENMQKTALTKVLVTHDFSLIQKLCNHVILLNQGKVSAVGKTEEILNNEELLLKNGL